MQIEYARFSTEDQNLDLQRDALGQLGYHRVFEDRASGATSVMRKAMLQIGAVFAEMERNLLRNARKLAWLLPGGADGLSDGNPV